MLSDAMNAHPSIKILVLLFSLGLASLMTWQLKKNIQKPAQEPAPEIEQAKAEPPEESEDQAITIGTKSAGAIRIEDSEELKKLFRQLTPDDKEGNDPEDEKKEEQPHKKPLLPGSKSRPLLPSSKYIPMRSTPPEEKKQE